MQSLGDTASATRERSPRGQGEQLRLDLLDATADLLDERGSTDGVSLRSVASRAGVSPTAVYQHFADHRTLIDAGVAHTWDRFADALAAASVTPTELHDRLPAMGEAYVEFAIEHPGSYRVLFSNELQRSGDAHSGSAFELLVAMVAEVLDAADDDRDPRFVSVQLHTWIHGMVHLMGCHPDFGWPEHDALLGEALLRLGLEGTEQHPNDL